MYATVGQVREPRFRVEGALQYVDGAEAPGKAAWADVSRVGGSMTLGRYLRPGRTIGLAFMAADGTSQRVQARIIWCNGLQDSPRFAAGFRILREDPETALEFSQLRPGGAWLANRDSGKKVREYSTLSGPADQNDAPNSKNTARMAALPHAV